MLHYTLGINFSYPHQEHMKDTYTDFFKSILIREYPDHDTMLK